MNPKLSDEARGFSLQNVPERKGLVTYKILNILLAGNGVRAVWQED